MQLNQLPKTTRRRKKRLGQGHGSGKVKTSGRGQKGQKARRNIPLFFEGGAQPLIKRLPLMRGKGRNGSIRQKPIVINLQKIQEFSDESIVDVPALIAHGLVSEKNAKKFGVKILGDGIFSKKVVVKVAVSLQAKVKIEKAGGSVEKIVNE